MSNDPVPKVTDSAGRPVPLERRLAAGGEGAVFAVGNDPGRVAKIYHRSPSPQTVEKLAAMIGLTNPRLASVAAWPERLLLDARTKQLAGFVMPNAGGFESIQHLYNPSMRLKFFAAAGWSFQVRAAKNLAAAFDEVHKANCLVGDVNQSNALVSRNAIVKLIDCDSFQISAGGRRFLCEVGVAQYTPPELQGKSLKGLPRTRNHDGFGLAVLIYQLLFVGRHPYQGIDARKEDSSFEQQIAQFRFAQGPQAATWQMSPPPHTPTFADIPANLGSLFRRAFEPGSDGGTRPTPTDWIDALASLERFTADCPADAGHTYWKGQLTCTWCRLADKGGPEYYFGIDSGTDVFTVDLAKLQEVRRRLADARPEEFRLDLRRFESKKRPPPTPFPDDLRDHRNTCRILGVAVVFCALLVPLALIRGYIGFIGFVGALIFGGWLAVVLATSPILAEKRRRRTRLRAAEDTLEAAEGAWEGAADYYRRERQKRTDSVERALAEWSSLGMVHDRAVERLQAVAEAAARLRHLRLHSLIDADIPNIGSGRKQTLWAHGIMTAADIDADRIRSITGFGQGLTANLLSWRDEVMKQFCFDPKSSMSAVEAKALCTKLRVRQKELDDLIQREFIRSDALRSTCRTSLVSMEPALRTAVATLDQAEADYRAFGRPD